MDCGCNVVMFGKHSQPKVRKNVQSGMQLNNFLKGDFLSRIGVGKQLIVKTAAKATSTQ